MELAIKYITPDKPRGIVNANISVLFRPRSKGPPFARFRYPIFLLGTRGAVRESQPDAETWPIIGELNVDPVQFRKRVDEFDFDITSLRFSMSSTPGEGLKSLFSSQAAATNGTRNLAGVADPVVDILVD